MPNGERPVIGNPFLTSATIDSVDLRWEQFLSPLELVSAGFFYKQLSNPIEQIVIGLSDGEADSFKNAQDAIALRVRGGSAERIWASSPHSINACISARATGSRI